MTRPYFFTTRIFGYRLVESPILGRSFQNLYDCRHPGWLLAIETVPTQRSYIDIFPVPTASLEFRKSEQ
jgi:hypothetical protein